MAASLRDGQCRFIATGINPDDVTQRIDRPTIDLEVNSPSDPPPLIVQRRLQAEPALELSDGIDRNEVHRLVGWKVDAEYVCRAD
jgi:hypothetical protein